MFLYQNFCLRFGVMFSCFNEMLILVYMWPERWWVCRFICVSQCNFSCGCPIVYYVINIYVPSSLSIGLLPIKFSCMSVCFSFSVHPLCRSVRLSFSYVCVQVYVTIISLFLFVYLCIICMSYRWLYICAFVFVCVFCSCEYELCWCLFCSVLYFSVFVYVLWRCFRLCRFPHVCKFWWPCVVCRCISLTSFPMHLSYVLFVLFVYVPVCLF